MRVVSRFQRTRTRALTLPILALLLLLALQVNAFSSHSVTTRNSRTTKNALSMNPLDVVGTLLPPPDVAVSTLTSWTETLLPQAARQWIQEQPPIDLGQQLPVLVGGGIVTLVAPQATALSKALQAQKVQQASVANWERTYPESFAATYELSNVGLPFEFGDAALVRPLLKQTQLENRPLQVVYDANQHGYNAKVFHQKVDGKGAAVVLCKAQGRWFGAYNPRGWASLGGSRPSRAAFLFYEKGLLDVGGGKWQKLRAMGGGGNACANDLFDRGIYMGAEALVIPLDGQIPKSVASRLGTYFEAGPQQKSTLLPRPAVEARLSELKVLTGVYATGEDIPNSGGVLDLGLY